MGLVDCGSRHPRSLQNLRSAITAWAMAVHARADQRLGGSREKRIEGELDSRFFEIDFRVVEIVFGIFQNQGVILVRELAAKLGGNAGP